MCDIRDRDEERAERMRKFTRPPGYVALPFPPNLELDLQVELLAKVLMEEFGGPTQSEGAIEMAIRVMREQQSTIDFMNDSAWEHAERADDTWGYDG